MKRYLNKKIAPAIMMFIGQFLLSPIKSFAEALEYHPLEPGALDAFGPANSKGDLTIFLQEAFAFGLAIAAALAVIMIVWGGVEIMLSESVFKKEDGHAKIKDAIYGLLLALVSWLILYIINPAILDWSNIFPK
jgi:hypothetical protein